MDNQAQVVVSEMSASTKFTLRRKVLKLFGASFEVFDQNGNLVMFASQKAFKLKEDIRLYSDPSMQQELIRIHARNIIDISVTYDVIDSKTETKIGALKRQALKSILKDEWLILDAQDNIIAKVKEDSTFLAIIRRFITNLIPQTYHIYNNSAQAFAELKRNFNPFVSKISLDFDYGISETLDKRMGLAVGVLMLAIEGKQN